MSPGIFFTTLMVAGWSFVSLQAFAQAPAPVSAAGLRQIAYLKASTPSANSHFGNGGALEGHGVAVSGDGNTLAVGAPYESSAAKGVNGNEKDTSLYSSGAVYVFVNRNGRWTQQAYLKASTPGQGDKFGHVVSLSEDGNTLAVAAVFESSATKGINGAEGDRTIPQAGAAYVFTRTGGTWKQQAYIKASNTGEAGVGDKLGDGDEFGFSLHLSADGNTLAVGAIAEDSAAKGVNGDQNDNSAQGSGAVYIYARAAGKWTQQAYLKQSNTEANNLFGYAVGLSADGNTLAATAYDEASSAREVDGVMDTKRRGSGAVYVFTRTGAMWAQAAYLKAHNAEAQDSMGYDVAISLDGNTIAAGAGDEDCLASGINPPGCDNDYRTDTSTGAAYVFVREGGKWKEQAFIKASNPAKEDWFGSRLALAGDGNTMAVSAQLENGNSQGINGNQADKTAEDSGAIYLFTRTGGTWAQKAYVKGSNTEAYDEFGAAPALNKDGHVLAVGARSEGSGVKGDPKDNSAMGAGAVYIFENK